MENSKRPRTDREGLSCAEENTSLKKPKADHKALRSSAEEKTAIKEDRLSNLPDDVLCHILSFLGTKMACRTSILSRSWRTLWTMLPDVFLFYREDQSRRFACFHCFVNRVFDAHKASRIRKFVLDCAASSSSFKPHHVSTWICGAISCHVERLGVKVSLIKPSSRILYAEDGFHEPSPDRRIDVPLSLFTCKTITVLKLQGNFFFAPSLSSSAWLPSLKVLCLITPYCCDEFVPSLLSACPVLEELYISRFSRVMKICAPRLKKLDARFKDHVVGMEDLEIDAPSLEYLSLGCHCPLKYSIKNLDKLLEAKILVTIDWTYRACLFELLKRLSNVKSLSFGTYVFGKEAKYFKDEEEEQVHRLCGQSLPNFHNLVRLRFAEPSGVMGLLPSILQKSPKLEILDIKESFSRGFWTNPQEVPCCLSSHLIKFTYEEFHGTTEGFKCVGYILKNSSVLKTVTIHLSMSVMIWETERLHIYRELAMLPRGSEYCKLEFDDFLPF